VQEFQDQRKLATDEVLGQYMTPRRLQWGGNPKPVPKAATDDLVTKTLSLDIKDGR